MAKIEIQYSDITLAIESPAFELATVKIADLVKQLRRLRKRAEVSELEFALLSDRTYKYQIKADDQEWRQDVDFLEGKFHAKYRCSITDWWEEEEIELIGLILHRIVELYRIYDITSMQVSFNT